MTAIELKRIKDISVEFAIWLDEYTIDIGPTSGERRILAETNDEMSYDDLFDYYVHTILTDIIIDKLDK